MADLKKFLDQQGVSTLWTKIAEKVATDIESEQSRAILAEQTIASDLADLKEYVGTIPDSYAEADVIAYVNKKAEETLAAAQGGSSETAASVKQQLDTYKAENDTKVNANTTALATLNGDASTEGSVAKTVADAVAAEATARDTAISSAIDKLEPRVKANEDNIAILVDEDTNKSVRAIANEELAKQLITEDAKESLDTLAEIAAWIQAHPNDASAMNEAIAALQAKLAGIDGTVKAYVDATIEALKIGDYAKAADLAAAITRIAAIEADYLKAADKTELAGTIALKANKADVVAELAKKQDVIPAKTYDAYGSAAQALVDAKAYTDTEINTKVIALTTAEIEAAIASAIV